MMALKVWSERLLSENLLFDALALALASRLRERDGDVERIVSGLAISKEEYVELLVDEVQDHVWLEVMLNKPLEEVKKKALEALDRKLERDLRLYAPK